MAKTVVAMFENYDSAEAAARQIKDAGLRTDDISIVAKHSEGEDTSKRFESKGAEVGDDDENNREVDSDNGEIKDNISGGVLTGGVFGGLAGLLIGAGSMMIPGLGIIAAAGPITGLISGAVTGGVVGGLVDLGIPEKSGRHYESQLKQGKILFSMRTDNDKVDNVANILRKNGAKTVDSY